MLRNRLLPAWLSVALSLPPLPGTESIPTGYDKWLGEDVHWIITGQERAAFQNLTTDRECDQFIEAIWARRDPTPGTPENELKNFTLPGRSVKNCFPPRP